MAITMESLLKVGFGGITLMALGLTACTTDDADPGEEGDSGGGSAGTNGGTSGASTGGSSSGAGGSNGGSSNGGSSGTSGGATKCASTVALASSAASIADFEGYADNADLSTWQFPFGGDVSSGILAGTFGYGDDHVVGSQPAPEAFEMVEGNGSMYALSISDSEALEWGGGMGIWITACLDATAFSGISFAVRGNAPNMGQATLALLMEETTSSTPSSATDSIGTCNGVDDGDTPTCVPPKATFEVTEEWTEIQLPWSRFTGATSPGQTVTVDGHNIWQIQFDIGLLWADDGTGTYVPTPAPYELVIDDLAFY